jgi:hypothetical protein
MLHCLHCRSFEGQDYAIPNEPNGDDLLFAAYGEGLSKGNYTGPVLFHAHPFGAGGKIKGLNKTIAYLKQQGYTFVPVSQSCGRPGTFLQLLRCHKRAAGGPV